MAPLNIITFGGSRNIGYLASVRLLEQGATVTFLLRSLSVFHNDQTIQKFVKSGSARLVKGDALVESDVRAAWDAAGVVDAAICSIGAVPEGFSVTKGIIIKPYNLCTQTMLNILCTMPTYPDAPQPKLIFQSSIGVTPAAFASLPLLAKLVFLMLGMPARDKAATERVIAHCAGWHWDPKKDGEPTVDMFGEGWKERSGLPAPGTLKHVLVVHAGILTDGRCKAEEGKGQGYRVSETECGSWISRKDAAHFMVEILTRRWDEYENKRVNVTY
ncbi:hypothetical protein FB45DRAFT_986922 [Roridomyces roridus]|uniref:NAD(P)-binding domain-containing protein n=1 Tax=Roridomyces roridus TaxID=1738132 RepID=A0AAD7CEQ5_9AGAR|nr:hypothetical protein FB45DRAFT_986922 [Roridomyces roridus]